MLTSLDQPPRGNDGTLWADYVELRALAHPDKCFSLGDIMGIAQRSGDLGRRFEPRGRWADVVSYVSTRQIAYGDSYPFEISDDRDTISLKYDATSTLQQLYLGLLIASSMRMLDKGRVNQVARVFEEISYLVFEKLLPQGAEIRVTWAGAGKVAPYQGTLFEKLTAIAKDLRCTANFKIDDFSQKDTGDGGMDIIGWHPMTDSREGMPIAIAQCGCSRDDWDFKQLEASPAKNIMRLPVMHPWSNYYFMPLDFRRVDGDWANKSDLGQVIIVDRARIIGLMRQTDSITSLPNLEYIQEAWDAQVA